MRYQHDKEAFIERCRVNPEAVAIFIEEMADQFAEKVDSILHTREQESQRGVIDYTYFYNYSGACDVFGTIVGRHSYTPPYYYYEADNLCYDLTIWLRNTRQHFPVGGPDEFVSSGGDMWGNPQRVEHADEIIAILRECAAGLRRRA